jgi:hypothetical protein
MAGRTVARWGRVYMDGYDMSGYARSIGALDWSFDEADLTALADSVKGFLPAQCVVGIGGINANLDTTATSGLHVIANAPGVSRVMMVPLGIQAEPAQGDAVYCGRFNQSSYQANEEGGAITVNLGFEGWDAGNALGYNNPWGVLLRPKTATTGANTSAGVDGLAASSLGGYLVYQVFAGNGTATISVDKSTTTNVNASFSALSGATTGELNFSTPQAGIIALGNAAAVGQYLRWQIALNSATSVTFALAFVRGLRN